jgi:hypothetical protein
MNLDIIGKMYDISGDAENPLVTELQGWHVNTTAKLQDLDAYLVTPTTPRRVFAGGIPTYCYTFASELECKQLLNWDATEKTYNPIFVPELPPVPPQVTRRQALTVLSLGGYLPQIEAALDAIEDAQAKTVAEIFWKESLHFERDNPLLNQLAEGIGMSQEDLDNLFRQAITL